MNRIYLFETIVGSHLWNMDNPDSDVDIFRCFIEDSDLILMGRRTKNRNYTEANGRIDIQESELQTVIEQLIINNYNYLIYIFSPLIRFGKEYRKLLQDYAKLSLSKQCYNSIHGLALGNYKKYIETGKDDSERRCNIICRTLQFGITLLRTGKIEFKKFEGAGALTVLDLLEELDRAKEESILQEECPEYLKKEMRDFLLAMRKARIRK